MNSEILGLLMRALSSIGSDAKPLPTPEARQIVAKAKAAFVSGNPRAWWMSLQAEPNILSSKGRTVGQVLPACGRTHWFIPETESNDLPVFDLSCSEIEAVLEVCPCFEYYVIDR
jgi:hypothetical protein